MYCTIEDLQKRLSSETLQRLADEDKDGQPDTDIMTAAIADADAEIDTVVGTRYKVPFTSPPPIIKAISVVLAVDSLFARVPGLVSKEHRERARQSRTLLRLIAHGHIDISQSDNVVLRRFVESTTDDTSPTFSDDTLENF